MRPKVGRKVVRGILLGKRVEVESEKNPCHPLVIIPELQQREVEIFSLVSFRTWDLRWSPRLTRQNFPPAWEWAVQLLQVDQTTASPSSVCAFMNWINWAITCWNHIAGYLNYLPRLCLIGEGEQVVGLSKEVELGIVCNLTVYAFPGNRLWNWAICSSEMIFRDNLVPL